MDRQPIRLLPEARLVRTGPVDHADWNYRAGVGTIQRVRFRLAVDLLGMDRYGRLLEVGYGSGVFMPELQGHCRELFGLDIHQSAADVTAALGAEGVAAQLCTGSSTALPFASGALDAVVAISSVEFSPEPEETCAEIARSLSMDGVFVVVTPAVSKVGDAGLRLVTGESARADYGYRRERTLAALRSQFTVDAARAFPHWMRPVLYRAFRLRKR